MGGGNQVTDKKRDDLAEEYGKTYAAPFDYDVAKAFRRGWDEGCNILLVQLAAESERANKYLLEAENSFDQITKLRDQLEFVNEALSLRNHEIKELRARSQKLVAAVKLLLVRWGKIFAQHTRSYHILKSAVAEFEAGK